VLTPLVPWQPSQSLTSAAVSALAIGAAATIANASRIRVSMDTSTKAEQLQPLLQFTDDRPKRHRYLPQHASATWKPRKFDPY
jgi:hypothetical protein